MSDKSTGQTVVNGVWSNVTYSFVSMVAGYDLYIIMKEYYVCNVCVEIGYLHLFNELSMLYSTRPKVE